MDEYSIGILRADFENAWVQARHHETVQISITSFLFTMFTGFTGGCFILLEVFGLTYYIESLLFVVSSLLCIIGLVFFALSVRNRYYFVRVMRYINEHRALALSHKENLFKNFSGFYTNTHKPRYYNVLSTFMLLGYTIALLNGLSFSSTLYFGYSILGYKACILLEIIAFLVFVLLQISLMVICLAYCEHRSSQST